MPEVDDLAARLDALDRKVDAHDTGIRNESPNTTPPLSQATIELGVGPAAVQKRWAEQVQQKREAIAQEIAKQAPKQAKRDREVADLQAEIAADELNVRQKRERLRVLRAKPL